MESHGESSGPGNGFVHQALIYSSDEEFIEVVAPRVEAAEASGEPTFVAVQEDNVENLIEALDGVPPGVTLVTNERWYATPAQTREKYGRWVEDRVDRGRVHLIGEAPLPMGHEAQLRDWARHESVLNVAFADLPVTLICPYDERALPDDVIDHAHATHPELVESGEISESADYEPTRDFCRRLDDEAERPPGDPLIETGFRLGDLPAMRSLIESTALDAGLSAWRAEEAVLAVNEIATNALLHGRPPARLRVWAEEDELVFEVMDLGGGIENVLAGQLHPPATQIGGRGLWLARQLCDAVEIKRDEACCVVLRVATPSASLAR